MVGSRQCLRSTIYLEQMGNMSCPLNEWACHTFSPLLSSLKRLRFFYIVIENMCIQIAGGPLNLQIRMEILFDRLSI